MSQRIARQGQGQEGGRRESEADTRGDWSSESANRAVHRVVCAADEVGDVGDGETSGRDAVDANDPVAYLHPAICMPDPASPSIRPHHTSAYAHPKTSNSCTAGATPLTTTSCTEIHRHGLATRVSRAKAVVCGLPNRSRTRRHRPRIHSRCTSMLSQLRACQFVFA